jgi:prephenate dehydratase
MAAFQYFGENNIEIVSCETFRKEFTALETRQCDFFLLAIENTIAGSILPNYSLLENSDFQIVGETYLGVRHCLMGLPGQQILEMEAVWSHPMALLQCEEFLAEYPNLVPVEKKDTASSAKEIFLKKAIKTAAIGPRGAAERYSLQIYAEDIQTHKQNFTRFLVIGRQALEAADVNKATLVMQLADKPGSLFHMLETFNRREINLTKIQSLPIIGKPYSYSFHFDMEWQEGTNWKEAMTEAQERLISMKILGVYKKGNRSDLPA